MNALRLRERSRAQTPRLSLRQVSVLCVSMMRRRLPVYGSKLPDSLAAFDTL
jgi:hypothetical protein